MRPGDTLFAIARRFGLDHRDIARWNRLGDGELIYPGQRLRLSGAVAATGKAPGVTAAPEPADGEAIAPPSGWRWPAAGALAATFGQSPKAATGILIAGRAGEAVAAALDGEVVYAGSGLASYGQLIIIRHGPMWLSAYGHNRELLVREGQQVRAGEQIARMGAGAGYEAVLHFEVRRNGVALDPLPLLPRR